MNDAAPTRHGPAARGTKGRIVVAGILFFNPVGGVVYQALHYLLGLRQLGYDVYYVEDTSWWSLDPKAGDFSPDPTASIELVRPILDKYGFGDRWAYRRTNAQDEPRRCWGMTDQAVLDLYRSCDAWLNVTGSQTVWDDVALCRKRILVETDPISAQIDVANGRQQTIDHLDAHHLHFTFGETMTPATCPVPLGPYRWMPTRQPVAMDLWSDLAGPTAAPSHNRFTSITSWHDDNKDRVYDGVSYRWTKDAEFLNVIDLPARHPGRFELAVTGRVDGDVPALRAAGWKLGDALALSAECADYQRFIGDSYGEFTVARQQYTLPRTGWFSDRSATYLAAGRPVITQQTGFSDVIPSGSGLYAWESVDDISAAVEAIDADPRKARADALDIAHSYFATDVVLTSLMDRAGL